MMGYGGMMGYAVGSNYGSTVGWWWILGLGVLRLILIAGLIILVIRLFKKNDGSYTSVKAIEILKERYATGEINEEEYKKKMKALR